MENRSAFMTLMKKHDVDFNQIWRETLALKPGIHADRAFSDEKETAFWETYSEKYDGIPSLYDDAPELLDYLISIVGEGKKLLEFGCGTGKFTIPLSRRSQAITAIDFSQHMLHKLMMKIESERIPNINCCRSKFETFEINDGAPFDSIYAVNANYRIIDMESALKKMNNSVRENVVLIWTMQRHMFDQVLNQFSVKGIERCQEYIYLINLLYSLGIDPQLTIKTVTKSMALESPEASLKALKEICNEHHLPYQDAKKIFESAIIVKEGISYYQRQLQVAFIHFKPTFRFKEAHEDVHEDVQNVSEH
ncbi:methyltransferase domain-containing protein [Fusibacter paucivorans]|uniref:Methyltransferase domain-containing protein n=1 Tax=Fusibacter paucivorans TaxID=76009 RepID=A0ABS5PRT0_9FIRM|nr:class I SAM-dependent methyltransferase [Fusibacter paucivorans]MBS7527863.1 methyltransferase domain-containing protein [Fusibacter paucivorans]